MIYVKNKQGRTIEISVIGLYGDDIQVNEAYYLDDPEEEVSENDIDYISENFQDEMYEDWFNNQVTISEYYYEGDR